MKFEKFTFGKQLLFAPIIYLIAVGKIIVTIPMAIIGLCNFVIEEYLSN